MPMIAQRLHDERAFHDALDEVFRLAPLIGVTWLKVEREENAGYGHYTRTLGAPRVETEERINGQPDG